MKRTMVWVLCWLLGWGASLSPIPAAEPLRPPADPFGGPAERKGDAKRPSAPADPQDEQAQEPPQVLRVYDVSDVFVQSPVYRAGRTNDLGDNRPLFPNSDVDAAREFPMYGNMSLGAGVTTTLADPAGAKGPLLVDGRAPRDVPASVLAQRGLGGVGAAPQAKPQDDVDEVAEAITSTIAPTSWDDVGGPSTVHRLGDRLLIRTAEANHKEIAALLDSLRQQTATRKQLTIDTHWLWLTEAQLRSVLVKGKPGAGPLPNLVDDAAWEQLQAKLAKDEEAREGYHAVITCLNGQTVSTVAGRQSRIVVSVVPVVGQGDGLSVPRTNAVGYQPVTTTIQEGAAIQVRPILLGTEVLLDVRARVVEVRQTRKSETASRQAVSHREAAVPLAAAAAVDRPVATAHRIETTLRIAPDRRVLIGGATTQSPPEHGQPNLYLFATVSVGKP